MLTNFDQKKLWFFCFPYLAIYKEKVKHIIDYFPFSYFPFFSKMNSSICLKILDLKIYFQVFEMNRLLRP